MVTQNPSFTFERFTGVDIAYKDFTAATKTCTTKPLVVKDSFAQTREGFDKFIKYLHSSGTIADKHLVVMEATGNYWIALAIALYEAGFALSVVNPAQAHYFAKAQLKRAKNDKLDAQTLCELGQALTPTRWTPPPQIYHEFRQRLTQHDNLLRLRTQVENQLHAMSVHPVIVESVKQQLSELRNTLCAQIKAMDEEIKGLLKEDSEWNKNIALLQTIPGIGILTASWLVVATVNFTLCDSPEALVRYAGLAPTERSSGSSIRGRPSIGHTGNSRLRTLLYLGTLSAVRFNPKIKVMWERLRVEKKKPLKVARCACARKMLHLVFAIIKKGEAFDREYEDQGIRALKELTSVA